MKVQWKYVLFVNLVLALALIAPAEAQSPEVSPGQIQGKVKERDGKALEDVQVRVTSAKNKGFNRETKSDNKGEFTLTGIPAGEYSLSFEKKGYKTFATRKFDVAPGETFKIGRTIELAREGEPYALIRGAVFYGPGYTMQNAEVLIERIDGGRKFKHETISRDGGEFAFRLRAEKAIYRITANARGFQPATLEIEIESDEVRNVALTLKK
jgi:hypothetical protein